MRRPEFLARQGRCPTGLLGKVVGRIMAHETSEENAAAVDLLELKPSDRVLEIGFGHGKTTELIARRIVNGFVVGVDLSAEMLRLASSRNQAAIARGKVRLRQGDSRSLEDASEAFDKVLAVHTVYFWEDAGQCFHEVRRVLRPNGLFVLAFRPKDPDAMAAFPATVYKFRPVSEICEQISTAGFEVQAVTERNLSGRNIAFVTARAGLLRRKT